tara:strand:+ start:179 stop:406 length:228 start_codon:yes stop_codon:yes gene_type:complete
MQSLLSMTSGKINNSSIQISSPENVKKRKESNQVLNSTIERKINSNVNEANRELTKESKSILQVAKFFSTNKDFK